MATYSQTISRHLPTLRVILCTLALFGSWLIPYGLDAEDAQPPTAADAQPAAPETAPAPQGKRIRITSERQLLVPGKGVYEFSGDVQAETDRIQISAQKVTYDAKQEQMTANGSVTVTEEGQTYHGETLEYATRTGKWRFRNWQADLSAPSLAAGLQGSIYVRGASATPEGNGLCLENTELTTCDLKEPHYALKAGRVEIYPGDRLVARDVDLYILGKRILHLPWFYIPLLEKRPSMLPEFGQNTIEGYFTRIPYQYVLDGNNMGMLRLDITQKRGVGLGLDHLYTLNDGHGDARFYYSTGSGDYLMRLAHEQQLPLDITANLSIERRRSASYYSSNSVTTASDNLQLARNTRHTHTLFNYSARSSDSTTTYNNTSATIRHEINTGADNVQLRSEFNSVQPQSTVGSPGRETLWNRLGWTHKFDMGDLNLRVDHFTDLASGSATAFTMYTGLQRLPEVTFTTDANRLGLKLGVPLRASLGWGFYRERADQDPVQRTMFELSLPGKTLQLGNTAVTPTAGLRQMVYTGNELTAQYSTEAGITAVTKMGALTNTLRYGILRQDGFTPLTFDTAYPRHSISDNLSLATPSLRLDLTAGRDLQWDRWHDFTLSAEVKHGDGFSMRHALGYDLNAQQWRDLVSSLTWKDGSHIALGLRTRYNLEQTALRTVGTSLSWQVNKDWRIEWQGDYNADAARFYVNRWLFTRDLHCWEVTLYTDFTTGSYNIGLRPKIFGNLTLPELLFGRTGDAVNTGVGVTF